MAATVVLVIFLVFLFGGVTLALGYGYLTTERERERERERLAAADEQRATVRIPKPVMAYSGFLPAVPVVSQPVAFIVDEAFVSQLEHHVRTEQALVAPFVHQPSIDNLYRQSGAPLHMH